MSFRYSFLIALFAGQVFPLYSQTKFWTDVPETSLRTVAAERGVIPSAYRTLSLDVQSLDQQLQAAPARFNGQGNPVVIELPMPDGSSETFAVHAAPLLEPALAARNPGIGTYAGQGISDPQLSVYLDLTPVGFHAMVLGPARTVFIDPYFRGQRAYCLSYDRQDFSKTSRQDFVCGYQPGSGKTGQGSGGLRNAAISLRTYRAAIAATGEYTQYHGSSANALAAITTTLNRVRGIFEAELAISFTLVANNSNIIYSDPATDPYSNSPSLAENQTNIDAEIGSANYDLGHLLDVDNGGVAGVGVVCAASAKAWGISGSVSPLGDPFDVDILAHEIGHQFGAEHTFNGNTGTCASSSRNADTAYEPGSGSTIMAYAGICGSQNIQWTGESHFHKSSLEEITNFVTAGNGSSCPVLSATGNNSPTVDANVTGSDGKYIPINTPFELTAAGNDPDGDNLFYSWEQWDLGSAGAPSASSDGPIFRSFAPASSPTRTFPRLADLLDDSGSPGEFLPSITRDLNFACTVRDVKPGGGGFSSDAITLHVTNSAADFAIVSQNTPANVEGTITLNWNVGNTTAAPVSCANVDILLSLDGGHSFSPLLNGTPNDGSQAVTLPSTTSGQARLKVKCSDNVFFDINNADLRIVPGDASCAEQVTNGNFAAGSNNWTEFSSNGQGLIGNWGDSYVGSNSAWLGYLHNETSQISQTISIPASPHFAKLEFWYKFLKFDCGGDVFRLKVNGSTVQTFSLCNNDAALDWKRELVDLSDYDGTSPTIMFELVTNGTHQTDVLIDAISLYTCTGGTFALLPVELVSFQAEAQDHGALLTWRTESESGNAGFEIEKQQQAGGFEKIGFVPGRGTTVEPQHYAHVVPDLAPGVHYFRLRQIDQDGQWSHSPVRAVHLGGELQFSVYPNPAQDLVFFEMNLPKATPLRLEVLNPAGQQVGLVVEDRFVEGQFRVPFEVRDLPQGVYFFHLTGEGFQQSGRFVVE